jgi:hypothetical protein
MHAAICSLLEGEPAQTGLPSRLDGGLPAAAIESTRYLDGREIHHGRLAAQIQEDQREPLVDEDGIYEVREARPRRVMTDVYADVAAGWAGVSTGDGEQLLADYLLSAAGVRPQPTELRLDAWAEKLDRSDAPDVNGVVYSHSIEEGHRRDAAGAEWHDDASQHVPAEGVRMLSVEYSWDGLFVDAALAESGYVAVYTDSWGVEAFARWVAEEVVPYLQVVEDDAPEQSELGDSESEVEA